MVEERIEVFAHPMCSPDLSPCYFCVFGALKWKLCNRHFESDIEFVTAVNSFFKDLPSEEFHRLMTAKGKERMLACIADDGGYFEKDLYGL